MPLCRTLLSLPLAICLWASSVLAEPSPDEAFEAMLELTLSWPADLKDLPALRGTVDTTSIVTLDNLRGLGLDLDDTWYGDAGIRSPWKAADRYSLKCKRIGADLLDYFRMFSATRSLPQGVMPEVPLFLMNGHEIDFISAGTPQDAEAAMRCEQLFRMDDANPAAVLGVLRGATAERFSDLQDKDKTDTGAVPDVIATGWRGEPSSGIGRLELSVFESGGLAGKIDIRVITYSWRLPSGS